MTNRTLLRACALVLGCALILVAAAPVARADCNIYGFYEGYLYGLTDNPEYIHFDNTYPTWSAIAVKPETADDWDVRLYSSTGVDPVCLQGLLASSTYGGSVVDFVIGDWAHSPLGTYYLQFDRYSGTSSCDAQWRAADATLDVNGDVQTRTIATNQLLAVWTVDLVAGRTYNITYGITSGTADLKLMLFRNPGTGSYFAGRSSYVYLATTNGTFTPTVSGTYAAVVVKDSNYDSGTINIGVSTCSEVNALSAGVVTAAPHLNSYWSFNQLANYWTAVAVRGGGDPDIGVYGNTSGAGYPYCLGDGKSGSYGTSGVDFVVGDFNHNAPGTYDAWTTNYAATNVEWESGSDYISTGAPTQVYSTGANDILRVWDVGLTSGATYSFYFRPTQPGVKMLLFKNPGATAYWAPRSSAAFEATGCQSYTATATDYYALVVVNDTGDSASYALGLESANCPCPTVLANEVTAYSPAPDGYFSFAAQYAPGNEYWAVVGTRGNTTLLDWDLYVSGNAIGEAAPYCLGTAIASSGYGAGSVDLVAMDCNPGHTPQGTYYARDHSLGGASGTGLIQFDASQGWIGENSPYVNGTLSTGDVVHVWDAGMQAGRTYTVEFYTTIPGAKLLIFESPASGSYIVGRASTRLTVTSTTTYTPSVSGWHALVLVNDQGGSGSYTFRYGACLTPTALANDVPVSPPYGAGTFSFASPPYSWGWGAIGTRSLTTDWDMNVGTGVAGTFPSCLTGYLAGSGSSNLNYIDFVVGDWTRNAVGTYYADVHQFSYNFGLVAPVEWSWKADPVIPDCDVPTSAAMGVTNQIDCWSVGLTAGVAYTFALSHTGAGNLHLLVFQGSGSTYWMDRSGAVLSVAPGSSGVYTAPANGWYGVVIVDDNGADDTYGFTVKACPTPAALTAGTPAAYWFESFNTITPSAPYWTGVGASCTYAPFVVEVNSSGTGGVLGVCQSGLLARSAATEPAQFVVGDFNHNPYATYYVRTHYPGTVAPLEWVDWDAGSDGINVGAAPVHNAFTAHDVLDVYDAFLTAGQLYSLYFTHAATVDAKAMVFRNPAAGTYWAPRSAAMYATSGHGSFTAPSTGWYGIVIVNDNQGSGDYQVALYPGGVGVEPPALPSVTSLRSVEPNPARGALNVELALRERASVRVRLVDLAGRVVASIADGEHGPGVWTESWNGHFADGTLAPPGMYLVRMEVDGRLIGQRKVALVR